MRSPQVLIQSQLTGQPFVIIVNEQARNIKYHLVRTIIVFQYHRKQRIYIITGKIQDVFHVSALKTENRLVIITYHKYVRGSPVRKQELKQFILRATGILKFINQN